MVMWISGLCFLVVLLFVDKIQDAFKNFVAVLKRKLTRRRYPYWYERQEES